MPSIECLIVREGRLLLLREASRDGTRPGRLLPVEARVQPGETPIGACVRHTREQTGFVVTPSCVALTFDESAETSTDYCLTFVADAPEGQEPAAAEALWLSLAELESHQDVPPLQRDLIPRMLTADQPVAIVLDVDTTRQPPVRSLRMVSEIDPARLSPLVFAIAPSPLSF
jgi:ADP-ribose pyrophosphatase YjhB (NUDIX family)